jgi:hypothetical protein
VNVALLCDSGERFDFSLCQRKPFALNPGGLKSLVKKPLDVEAVADAKDRDCFQREGDTALQASEPRARTCAGTDLVPAMRARANEIDEA